MNCNWTARKTTRTILSNTLKTEYWKNLKKNNFKIKSLLLFKKWKYNFENDVNK